MVVIKAGNYLGPHSTISRYLNADMICMRFSRFYLFFNFIQQFYCNLISQTYCSIYSMSAAKRQEIALENKF